MTEESSIPDFEIDRHDEFAQFFLSNRSEILLYLSLLARRHCLVTAYINEGRKFFQTSVIALDESAGALLLAPPQTLPPSPELTNASRITLMTNLDSVKIQIRLPQVSSAIYQGQDVLLSTIPEAVLRLQRRDFFRLEPPASTPIHCKLAALSPDGTTRVFELPLSDISGGGVSLIAPTEIAAYFPGDALFRQCRLEIPNDGVVQVNLRVRKTVEMSSINGLHSLRIGCEFVNLPGSSQSFIERYIARIERERKARDSGLVD